MIWLAPHDSAPPSANNAPIIRYPLALRLFRVSQPRYRSSRTNAPTISPSTMRCGSPLA